MIVDGIQDKFLDDTIAAINNMVALILKFVWLCYCMHQYFLRTLPSLIDKYSTYTGEVNLFLVKNSSP